MWLISALTVAVLSQSNVSQRLPTLDWPATRKMLKSAEQEIAAFRMTQPRVRRVEEHVLARILRGVPNALMIAQSGNRVQRDRLTGQMPALADHRGNLLVGRRCTFSAKYVMVTSAVDAVAVEYDPSRFTQTDPLDMDEVVPDQMFVVHGLIANQYKDSHFPFADLYPGVEQRLEAALDAAALRKKTLKRGYDEPIKAFRLRKKPYEKRIKDAKKALKQVTSDFRDYYRSQKHELRLQLPVGYRPPNKTIKRFKAEVIVLSVQWDRSAFIPHFIIHARLVKSKVLNLDHAGILDPNEVR